MITYHYECEDKSKKYDCPHCPDWFDEYGITDDEEEECDEDYEEDTWGWEGDDYVRRPAPAKVKSPVKRHFRSLWKHFSHILLRHEDEICQFLLTKQKLIPIPKWCRGDCVYDEIENEEGRDDDHQTGWIDKLTDDMICLEDALPLLSDDWENNDDI